jgi:hypothetical protein
MRKPILVALCVITGGSLRTSKLQSHVNDCTCRHQHPKYKVQCFDCEVREPPGSTSDAITKRALICAEKGLEMAPDAAIGLGMESGNIILCSGLIPIITPIAAAVMVYRDRTIPPVAIITTSAEGKRGESQELLKLCQEAGFRPHDSAKCLMEQALQKVAQ